MLKLQFNLRHQDIYLVNRGEVVATDSKNYLVAHFNTLTDDWETPLTAIFTDDKHKQPYAVIVGASEELEENECFVPWEVLTDECNVYVSVYCGNLHTTVTAAFRVQKSGYVEGETPPPPSPTVYDIIIQAIEDLRAEKQDKLIAGQNITIEGNVISASGGASDYTDLENKPQINSHTLSGNQSSDDLGLQKKLTAGTNITIGNDGTISASGGVTSYNDLSDKPVLRIQTGSITENITIEDVIRLTPFYKIPGTDIIALDTSRLYSKTGEGISSFTNFDRISDFTRGGVVYCNINAEGIPSFINARDRRFVVYHFEALHDSGCAQLIFWVDNTSGESKSAFRVGTGGLWQASNWVELTGSGGSQIVSGVVNQNGTITFTDSDGNTFTTTGSSVIGADGFSPTATVTQTASGATVSITDSTGTTTANISNGADGQDYVLTAQDKSDIADIVLSELPTTQGVLYGNTSN